MTLQTPDGCFERIAYAGATVLLLWGCAGPAVREASVQLPTPSVAREQISSILKDNAQIGPSIWKSYKAVKRFSVDSDALVIEEYRFPWSEITVAQRRTGMLSYLDLGQAVLYVGDEARFINAVRALKRQTSADESPEEEARFRTAASSYQRVKIKPEIPEDARRFKVQAEAALRRGDLQGAADAYGQALRVAPWWPEGHFNRAQVFGELGNRRAAIREMQRYLILEPNALDARAARDKIYEWEAR